MPRPSTVHPRSRPSGGERVVSDDQGLLWSAMAVVESGEHLVMFTCISDARRSGRITSVTADASVAFADVPDEAMREWLRNAPPIGRLS